MKRFFLYITVLLSFVLTACNDDYGTLIRGNSPSVKERFIHSMEYNRQYGYANLQADGENYLLYVCTDTHVATKNDKLKQFIGIYRNDLNCPVAVCLGDLVEANHSYYWFEEAIRDVPHNPLKSDTMFVTLGNHDIFYDQWVEYTKYWPTSTYYFTVTTPSGIQDAYICLDSAEGSMGGSQLEWLTSVLESFYAMKRTGIIRHIIVYTHVNIFRRDNTSADISTLALEETYELMSLFSRYGVEQFWAGHDHSREEFSQGGVKYIIVDSMEEDNSDAAFMILHVGAQLNNTFHFLREFENLQIAQ